MSINSVPGGPPSPVTALPRVTQAGETVPDAGTPPTRGSPESRYLIGSGKSVSRQVTELRARHADAAVKVVGSQGAVQRAVAADQERKENHRGGDRTWLLRWLIPIAVLAEAVTAYVAMQALVASQSLAIALAVLAALIGAGMACTLANRRLNQLPVPNAARVLEGIFVVVLTALRYDSLHIQSAGGLTAAGGAALAGLISALGLLGIEEIVIETRTFSMFLGTLRLSWKRWRYAAAETRLARIQAKLDTASYKLQQHYLDFLLKSEALPLNEARTRAASLKAALTDDGA
jgi:hypothetical protein